MTRYRILHRTHYDYGATVDLSYHLLRLTPPDTKHQSLLDRQLDISPTPAAIRSMTDHFGNRVEWITLEAIHEALTVEQEVTVEVRGRGIAPGAPTPAWEEIRTSVAGDGFPVQPIESEYAYTSPYAVPVPSVVAYASMSFAAGRSVLDGVRDLTARIRSDFTYVPGSTELSTPVAAVMKGRRGVCQDFAHVMIAGLRAIGLPARYVSGYLRTYPPAGGAELRGADATHAWVSVWCGPELGWVETDPTNDMLVEDEHIVLAYGRDFGDISPLRGVILGGGDHEPQVEVTVTPLPEG